MIARLPGFAYDARLTPMSRLYLMEIYKCNQTVEYCKVDDRYYASLFKVSTRQVRNWRTELKKYGYVREGKNEFDEVVSFYAPKIENHIDEGKLFKVAYITKEGEVINNYYSAWLYFHNLGARMRDLVGHDNLFSKVYQICHLFAGYLFNEKYYGIQMNNGIVLNQDFYQYVIEHFELERIYKMANRVFYNISNARNWDLYILASIANEFRQDYIIFQESPDWNSWREKIRRESMKVQNLDLNEKAEKDFLDYIESQKKR